MTVQEAQEPLMERQDVTVVQRQEAVQKFGGLWVPTRASEWTEAEAAVDGTMVRFDIEAMTGKFNGAAPDHKVTVVYKIGEIDPSGALTLFIEFAGKELHEQSLGGGVATPASAVFVGNDLVLTSKSAQGATSLSYFKKAPEGAEDMPEVTPCSFVGLWREANSKEQLVVFGSVLCSFATGFQSPLFSFFMDELFNCLYATGADRNHRAWVVFWKFISIGLAGWFLNTLAYIGLTRTGDQISLRLRVKFFKQLMSRDVGWYDTHSTAQMSTRLTQDAYDYRIGTGQKMHLCFQNFMQFPAGVAVAFIKSWKLAGIMVCVMPIMGLVMGPAIKVMMSAGQKLSQFYSEAGGVAETSIGSIQTVAAFDGYKIELDKYDKKLACAETNGVKMARTMGIAMGAFGPLIYGIFAFGFYVGSFFMLNSYENECWDKETGAIDGCFNGGKMMSVLYGILTGGMGLVLAMQQLQAVVQARSAAARMYQILDAPPAFEMEAGEDVHAMDGTIEFKEVTFSYPTRQDTKAVDTINYQIPAGSTVAFVGPSGSGKSTSINLLMRYYDPQTGLVMVDGKDIKTMNLKQLRSHFALVQQEPILFGGSILFNILCGKENGTELEAKIAAKLANAHNFIEEKAKGYETEVGERGVTLSGGQKQRIAIARAMIRKPKVLLLDEATSALDTVSEGLVMEALEKVMSLSKTETRMTTIMVAHRLSTVRNCDTIFVLEMGKLVEQGSHDALMQKQGGLYAQLVELQKLGVEQTEEKAEEQPYRTDSTKRHISEVVKLSTDRQFSKGTGGSFKAEEAAINGSFVSNPCKDPAANADDGVVAEDAEKEKLPEEDEKEKNVSVLRLWELAGSSKVWFFIALALTVPQAASGPFLGREFGTIINTVSLPPVAWLDSSMSPCEPSDPGCKLVAIYNKDQLRNDVDKGCLMFVYISLVMGFSSFISAYGAGKFAERVTRMARFNSFKAMLRQEMAYFDIRTSNMLTDRLAHEASQIKNFAGVPITGLVMCVVSLLTALIIVFLKTWLLPLTLCGLMPFMMIGTATRMNAMKKQDETRAGPIVSEAMGNIRTVAAFNMQGRMEGRYETILKKEVGEDKRQGLWQGMINGYTSFVMFAMYGATVRIAVSYIEAGWMNADAVFIVLFTLMSSLQSAAAGWTSFTTSKKGGEHAVKHVFNTIDREPDIDAYMTKGQILEATAVKGSVSFKNVVFCYPSQPHNEVFKKFSLEIEAGQNVALVGPSGSGKSTTVRLIQRFYDPQEGAVLFDGHDIRELNLPWLRSQLGFVQQEPVLFQGTVADNIRYGKQSATEREIEDAAKAANAYNFIMGEEFPKGFDTDVGERGGQISGGQKQRIAIARCMVRQPKVLLLDEATSALDTASEKVVQDALDKLFKEVRCTKITIAHRLATIQNCDVICVVYNGQIVEKGTHSELLAIKDGHYVRLAARQKL